MLDNSQDEGGARSDDNDNNTGGARSDDSDNDEDDDDQHDVLSTTTTTNEMSWDEMRTKLRGYSLHSERRGATKQGQYKYAVRVQQERRRDVESRRDVSVSVSVDVSRNDVERQSQRR